MTEKNSIKANYTVQVSDNAMKPTFLDGDILYGRYIDELEYDGQVVIIAKGTNNDAGFICGRGYKQDEGYILVFDNSAYLPMMLNEEEFLIVGKVVGFTRMFSED